MSAVDEVKQRTDIVEVVSQYASLKKAGRNLTALCPFHSEKHPSFFVYPEQQSWHCFGACNTGGDVFSFLMRKEGIDFGEALRLLAQRAGVSLPSRTEREGGKEEKEGLYQINEATALYFNNLLQNSPAAEKARGYVTSRGFSQKTMADFQLGFSLDSWEALKQYLLERGYQESTLVTAGLLIAAEDGKTHDRFRGKLMFPIRDIKGRTIGFGARALDDSMPKYTNSPQTPTFDKSSNLYGIDLAATAIRQQDMAIIMEGYMDVITAHQNGITNVVASMGTAVTETQVSTLKRLSRNLILALDADAAGGEAMLRGTGYEKLLGAENRVIEEAPLLKGIEYENLLNAEIRVIIMPEGSDPDDVIKEDIKTWQNLVDKAIPIVDFTFDKATSQLDMTTARDKSLARERLLPIVAEIRDTTRHTHYLRKLASLTKDNIKDLETTLQQIRAGRKRYKTQAPKQETITRALHPLMSNPREEYCLALLLQYPELKDRLEELSPEYFSSSENREIFTAWQETDDLPSLKDKLDSSIHEHLDAIVSRDLLATKNNIEQRYNDCVIELKKQYLRRLAALRAESGDTSEEDLEISTQLKEIFAHRQQKRSEMRR